jgi:hypothetical protein
MKGNSNDMEEEFNDMIKNLELNGVTDFGNLQDYLAHGEPDLAYQDLCWAVINANLTFSQDLVEMIVDFGMRLDILSSKTANPTYIKQLWRQMKLS